MFFFLQYFTSINNTVPVLFFAILCFQDIPAILSRIHCIQAFDIFSVLGALEKLKETLKNEVSRPCVFFFIIWYL